jgi:hypothetical protein
MPWDQNSPLGMVELLSTITIFRSLYPHVNLAMLVRSCHHIDQCQNLTKNYELSLIGYSMFFFV